MAESPEQLRSLEDDELVQLCQQQLPYQLQAYRELLRRHESVVFSTCISMLGNVQDAEEVTQDAFVQVFNKIHQFERRSAFKTWLYRIVFNMCLNRRKSTAARRNREMVAGEEMAQDQESMSRQPASGHTMDDRVTKALGRLKPDDQEIIRLRFVAELSLAEISQHLKIGLSATKMRLYRAMEDFKKHYEALPGEGSFPLPPLQSGTPG